MSNGTRQCKRRSARPAVALLLVASLLLPAPAAVAGVTFSKKSPDPLADVPVAPELPEDLELFRARVLQFVHEMEDVLAAAMQEPQTAEVLGAALQRNGLSLPFSAEFYEIFEAASVEDLHAAREWLIETPELLQAPSVLRDALAQISQPVISLDAAGDCTGNYGAFDTFKEKRRTLRTLKRVSNGLTAGHRIVKAIKEIVGAPTEDTPFVGRLPALILIGLTGLADVGINVVALWSDIIAFQKDEQELSIAACCQDASPSERLFGRGCDNRDNNCAGGTDEPGEDRFAPSLLFDSTALARCHPSRAAALDALDKAITASDDCSEVSPDINLNVISPICTGLVIAQVRDDGGNTTLLGPVEMTIDENPPVLTVPPLQACYATLADARNDIARTVVQDCTDVQTDVDVVSADCAADLTFTAVDECGRRSEHREAVRVDGTPPQVKVRKLLLPSVDGTFCFASRQDAIDAVASVAVVEDNCTAFDDLILDTSASGTNVCDLTITTSAIDECSRVGLDRLPIRVDTTPPVVTCSVAVPKLWPADGSMVDVGFSMSATDDCDAPSTIAVDVQVTSDEPTALARRTLGADPYPDAELLLGGAGNVTGIRLRAERTDYGPADGRVYRIRVTATDSCGLSSHTDCYVNVPRQLSSGQAVNSGQDYDATRVN